MMILFIRNSTTPYDNDDDDDDDEEQFHSQNVHITLRHRLRHPPLLLVCIATFTATLQRVVIASPDKAAIV
jgi:hypothetical protein